jgi:glycolate oxidase
MEPGGIRKMDGNSNQLAQDLRKIVGEDHVYPDLTERISYSETLLPYDLERADLSDVVVLPANAQEISEVLKYANEHRIPVTTFGSGTSLMYCTKPKHQGITLSTERLTSLTIDEDSQWVECGAGVKTGRLINELDKLGYFFQIRTQAGSSIGGAVSINTIGHLTDNVFGRPVNNVLALEVVLPTGEVIQTGSKSLRRAAGWDLTRVFIGSEGIIGIITKVRMILYPKPELADVVGFFKTTEEIGHAMGLIYKKKIPLPMDGELVGEKACKIGYEAYGLDFPEGAMAVCRSMGKTKEEALKNGEAIVELFKSAGAIQSYIIKDEAIREKVWGVRENAFRWGQEKGLRGFIAIEVNPPLPRLAEAIGELNRFSEEKKGLFTEVETYLYGHVGSDSLHFLFAWPFTWPKEKVKQLLKEMWEYEKELNIKYDGVGGDWGQLPYRVPFYREKYGEASYEIIKKMKQLFDPNNILNPGNLEGEI